MFFNQTIANIIRYINKSFNIFLIKNFSFLRISLPKVLEYSGEFGNELVLFLPFCNWLSKEGLLKKKYIKTYRGMRCFYDNLDCRGIIEKNEIRRWVPMNQRPHWLPVKNEHTFDAGGQPSRHVYPDFRSKYSQMQLDSRLKIDDRPLLIIHNKYNTEWHSGPVNHLPLSTLDRIFDSFKKTYNIVYIRHGLGNFPDDYSADDCEHLDYADRQLLQTHPEIFEFNLLFKKNVLFGGINNFNSFKNTLYSRCYHFISSQGGGAYQISYFSGSLMIIYHQYGHELGGEYGKGHFNFKTNIAPIRLICRSQNDLLQSLPILECPCVIDKRVLIDPKHLNILDRLSPFRDFGDFQAEPPSQKPYNSLS